MDQQEVYRQIGAQTVANISQREIQRVQRTPPVAALPSTVPDMQSSRGLRALVARSGAGNQHIVSGVLHGLW